MSIAQVMKMNTRDKMKLASSITRQNYWTQQTLAEMNFSQSETPQKENRKKRSIDEVQHMAGKVQPRIQLTLSKAGKLERKTIQTQPRKKGTKKKTKIDNKQVTLLEKWNIQDKGAKVGNTVNRPRNKRQTTNKK